MVIECCSQERTYEKFYGLVGERFSKINRDWSEAFKECFATNYETIHRLETNPLRNVAKYFGHLMSTDALPWDVLSVIHLNEEETTSSSRIFIKILFQDLVESLGLKKLNERVKDPYCAEWFSGLFPKDNPKSTRFAINFFTSIGLGALTTDLREHLKVCLFSLDLMDHLFVSLLFDRILMKSFLFGMCRMRQSRSWPSSRMSRAQTRTRTRILPRQDRIQIRTQTPRLEASLRRLQTQRKTVAAVDHLADIAPAPGHNPFVLPYFFSFLNKMNFDELR